MNSEVAALLHGGAVDKRPMPELNNLGLAIVRMLCWFGATGIFCELTSRAGAGIIPFLRKRGPPAGTAADLDRFGFGFLAGLGMLGLAYLGIALTGLFLPTVLLGAGLAGIAGSRETWRRRLVTARAARAAASFGPAMLLPVACLLPIFKSMTVPEREHDALVYHLGFPWQVLQAHRFPLEHVPHPFFLPLPVDLAFGLPLAVWDERMVRCVLLGSFLAAAATFAAWLARRALVHAAWLGPLLVLSAGQVLLLLQVAKNDVAAAAFFVAGALAMLDARRRLGACMLGFAVASKIVYGPLSVILFFTLLWFRPRPAIAVPARARGNTRAAPPPAASFPLAAVILLGCATVPWWVSTWLATNNPVYPFASTVFRSPDWNEPNRRAFALMEGTLMPHGRPTGIAIPAVWAGALWRTHAPVWLLLPLLLASRRTRVTAVACVVGQIVTVAMVPFDRYLLPSAWLLAGLGAGELERFVSRRRGLVFGIAAAAACTRMALAPEFSKFPWRSLITSYTDLTGAARTSAADAERLLAGAGGSFPGITKRPKAAVRVLSVGEMRTYRFPARLVFNGMFAETPVIWRIARESATTDDIRRRIRQLGTPVLLYNYVSVDWASLRYDAFPWDARALRLFVDYCKRHLEIRGRSDTCDFLNGGFYVFDFKNTPVQHPPEEIWFAPGTDSLYGRGIRLANDGKLKAALKSHQAVLGMLPDVGQAWNQVGHAYMMLSDAPSAYSHYRRFALLGMMDGSNLSEFGSAAINVGDLSAADRFLGEAFQRYPFHRNMIGVNRALWHALMAAGELKTGRSAEAASHLDRGEAILMGIPETLDAPRNTRARRIAGANLLAVRGELLFQRGAREQAADCFRRAAEAAHDAPVAKRWRELASSLVPRS